MSVSIPCQSDVRVRVPARLCTAGRASHILPQDSGVSVDTWGRGSLLPGEGLGCLGTLILGRGCGVLRGGWCPGPPAPGDQIGLRRTLLLMPGFQQVSMSVFRIPFLLRTASVTDHPSALLSLPFLGPFLCLGVSASLNAFLLPSLTAFFAFAPVCLPSIRPHPRSSLPWVSRGPILSLLYLLAAPSLPAPSENYALAGAKSAHLPGLPRGPAGSVSALFQGTGLRGAGRCPATSAGRGTGVLTQRQEAGLPCCLL